MTLSSEIAIWRKCKGIGLLELMLALVIISLLIVMASRYYQAANNNRKIAEAAAAVHAVIAAEQRWRVGQNLSTVNWNAVNISLLVSANLLPKEWGTGVGANPWGGDIVLVDSGFSGLSVKLTGMTSNYCTALSWSFGGIGGTGVRGIVAQGWAGGICTFFYTQVH